MNELYSLHVMPLLPGREAELADDAENLLQDGICSGVACIMTLVPEGDPVDNKAAVLAKRFTAFRDAFHGDKSKVGILIQATIGHGWPPDEQCTFQKQVRSDGSSPYQMCPLDKDFLAYVDAQISQLAALKPGFFMVDDDFRLVTGRNGCWCPLHLEAMNRRTGKNYTRETLLEAIRDNPVLADDFDAVQLDSLIATAKVIRGAIDKYAPETPCSFCTCTVDVHHANAIQNVLAGSTGLKLVRINNARYCHEGMRYFANRMYDGAAQIAQLDPDTTVLAETDTCPQSRWSTAAALLHAHFTGSILEGCAGAKHWITRTALWEPREGVAYRKILKKNSGFYTTLAHTLETASPAPFAAAILPGRHRNSDYVNWTNPGAGRFWGQMTSRMGIPTMFVKDPQIPGMLTGEEVDLLTDAQLENAARHGLVLSGSAAVALTKRGLTCLCGVEADHWNGAHVSCEFNDAGEIVKASPENAKVTPLGKAEPHGKLVHRRSGTDTNYTDLGPAVFYTENCFGARVAVFASTFCTGGFDAFAYLNLQRKQEMLEALEYVVGGKIAFMSGDDEVYMKQFRLDDGKMLFAFINLSFDPMNRIPLSLPVAPTQAEYLTPDGKWAHVPVDETGIVLPLAPAGAAVIRIIK